MALDLQVVPKLPVVTLGGSEIGHGWQQLNETRSIEFHHKTLGNQLRAVTDSTGGSWTA